MTPHKYSAGGTFVVDRRFKGIGRVRMATGITHPSTFRAFDDALTVMAGDTGGREWIRAMQRGDVAPLDVWGAYKTGDATWKKGPDFGTAGELVKSILQWREDYAPPQVSDDTYRVRKQLATEVEREVRAGATIFELPAALRAIKRRMKNTAPSFNQLMQYARAYVRDTLGKRHELYQVLKFDIAPIAIPGYGKKKERKRHPLTPLDVARLANAIGEHGHHAIGMALTGMNPKEYFMPGGWRHLATSFLEIEGTKRPGRDRIVPRLFPSKLWTLSEISEPTITRHHFEDLFNDARDALRIRCTVLDLRRSFANWLEAAGVDRTRRRMYMGHGAKDVTDLYETQDLAKYIAADRETVIVWLDEQLQQQGPQLVQEVRS